MLELILADLASFHPLRINRTIYVPAWDTTLDEIEEATGLEEMFALIGDYYAIDIPEELDD